VNAGADSLGLSVAFVWLGLVLGISFLEAPLKFHAPGITLPLGLGIGRLVFRALNSCELVLAVMLVAARATGGGRAAGVPLACALLLVLLVQVLALRPGLDRRAQAVIDGAERTASHRHVAYIALELVKVLLLLAAGIQLAVEVVR
jgi:hypothetical protein